MVESQFERLTSLLRRGPVLEACQGGPLDRSAIVERAACSRATTYRATDDLEDRGLIERVAEGYVLTGAGRTALEQLRRFQERIRGTERLAPVLSVDEAPELARHTHLLADATVVEDDAETPYRIERHVTSIIDATDGTIRGASTFFGSPTTVSRTVDRIEAGVEFEWTFPREMLAQLRCQHDDVTEAMMDHDATAYYVVDDVSVNLALYGETLVLMEFDDDRGILAAVATTDDPDAVAWGRRILDEHRERGERVD